MDYKEVLLYEIMKNYHKDEKMASDIVERLIEEKLKEAINDSSKIPFIDFYKKYINGMSVFQASDFTKTQILGIIAETPLTERDRNMARLYWVELKSEEDIADTLMIDKKTVRANIPKIRGNLNNTCIKMYGKD